MEAAYVRYLASKATVDDRSLNQGVLAELRTELAKANETVPEILELGAGVGTMVARLLDWGIVRSANFTLVDYDAASLEAARKRLASRPGAVVRDECELNLPEGRIRFVCDDALRFVDQSANQHRFDLVVANAVLDLMDLRPALARIWQAPRPNALFWFTINYDGQTSLLPESALDALVLRLYDESMDARVRDGMPCGDSKTGRHLLEAIPATGATLLAAGSSDWVVFPKRDGQGNLRYPHDEAYFLHHLVGTMERALGDHPELGGQAFGNWIEARHAQIDRAELSYLAHQLDVVGRAP